MKIRRFVLSLFLGIFVIASLTLVIPQDVAHAGCGIADCPTATKHPSGGEGARKNPITAPPTPTSTPASIPPSPAVAIAPVQPGPATPTNTPPTNPAWVPTWQACWQATYTVALTALANQPPPGNEVGAEATADNGSCYARYGPTATATVTPWPTLKFGGKGFGGQVPGGPFGGMAPILIFMVILLGGLFAGGIILTSIFLAHRNTFNSPEPDAGLTTHNLGHKDDGIS